LRQRAGALIRIAHPDVRGELTAAFKECRHVTLSGTSFERPSTAAN
jgi:acyl-CoA hydrolase